MQRYPIKFKLIILFVSLLFAFLLITIWFNIQLIQLKPSFILSAKKYFPQNVSIDKIVYLPPNFIILTSISVQEDSPEKKEVFYVPVIFTKFSMLELLVKKKISILDARLYRMQSDYPEFARFLKENYRAIIDFIQNLPKQNFIFILKEARFDFPDDKTKLRHIKSELTLKISKNYISGFGSIDKGKPLDYNFGGYVLEDEIFFENLEISRKDIYAKLSGGVSKNILMLNGFALMDVFKAVEYQKPTEDLGTIKSLLKLFRPKAKAVELPGSDVQIFNIDCRINFQSPEIKIERLNFFLNRVPCSIKGGFSLGVTPSLDLTLQAFPKDVLNLGKERLKRIGLKIGGRLRKDVFNGSGEIGLEAEENTKPGLHLKEARIDFKDLSLFFTRWPIVNMVADDLDIFCSTNHNKYSVAFEDLNAIFNFKSRIRKFIKIDSKLYDGFLHAETKLDLNVLPPRINSVLRIRDTSANNLDSLLVYFSKAYGKMSSLMFFRNTPHLNLNGYLNIRDGDLIDFDFFKWLAEFFELPSLRKVNFSRVFSRFRINTEKTSLYDIDLVAKDVTAGGYFSLGLNSLVSSKLSLGLTKEIMKESAKLTPLVNLLRNEPLDYLVFDFQLSGDFTAMNFQWLQSELKTKLQDAIPGFIERRLQRNIEEAIVPLQ